MQIPNSNDENNKKIDLLQIELFDYNWASTTSYRILMSVVFLILLYMIGAVADIATKGSTLLALNCKVRVFTHLNLRLAKNPQIQVCENY